jgi:hypothetical protein
MTSSLGFNQAAFYYRLTVDSGANILKVNVIESECFEVERHAI